MITGFTSQPPAPKVGFIKRGDRKSEREASELSVECRPASLSDSRTFLCSQRSDCVRNITRVSRYWSAISDVYEEQEHVDRISHAR